MKKTTYAELEKDFEELCEEVYGYTIRIGWLDIDILTALKSDPIAWRQGVLEYIECESRDGKLVEEKGEYFRIDHE